MLKNISQKLALTTAGMLGLAVISQVNPAQAALFNYNFTVTADGTTGTGSFSYDDSSTRISEPGLGDLFKVSSLNFSWLGKTYTAADDSRLSSTPSLVPAVYVQSGTSDFLNALDYSFVSPDLQFLFNPSSNGSQGSTTFSAYNTSNGSFASGTVAFSRVPEPSSVLGTLVLGALGAGAILKRQQKLS